MRSVTQINERDTIERTRRKPREFLRPIRRLLRRLCPLSRGMNDLKSHVRVGGECSYPLVLVEATGRPFNRTQLALSEPGI